MESKNEGILRPQTYVAEIVGRFGDPTHIFWDCPKLDQYWRDIQTEIKQIKGVDLHLQTPETSKMIDDNSAVEKRNCPTMEGKVKRLMLEP